MRGHKDELSSALLEENWEDQYKDHGSLSSKEVLLRKLKGDSRNSE